MDVYGFDFAYAGVYGVLANENSICFAHADTDTGVLGSAVYTISNISGDFVFEQCAHSVLERVFMHLTVPHDMDLDGIDVLIKVRGGFLRLDPHHYNYGLYYNESLELVHTDVTFKCSWFMAD